MSDLDFEITVDAPTAVQLKDFALLANIDSLRLEIRSHSPALSQAERKLADLGCEHAYELAMSFAYAAERVFREERS